jgi:hypothetical protein
MKASRSPSSGIAHGTTAVRVSMSRTAPVLPFGSTRRHTTETSLLLRLLILSVRRCRNNDRRDVPRTLTSRLLKQGSLLTFSSNLPARHQRLFITSASERSVSYVRMLVQRTVSVACAARAVGDAVPVIVPSPEMRAHGRDASGTLCESADSAPVVETVPKNVPDCAHVMVVPGLCWNVPENCPRVCRLTLHDS